VCGTWWPCVALLLALFIPHAPWDCSRRAFRQAWRASFTFLHMMFQCPLFSFRALYPCSRVHALSFFPPSSFLSSPPPPLVWPYPPTCIINTQLYTYLHPLNDASTHPSSTAPCPRALCLRAPPPCRPCYTCPACPTEGGP